MRGGGPVGGEGTLEGAPDEVGPGGVHQRPGLAGVESGEERETLMTLHRGGGSGNPREELPPPTAPTPPG